MPSENEQLRWRVRSRDRKFLGTVAAVAVAATPAAVLLGHDGTATRAGLRCVSTIRAGFMGGETHTYCGAAARLACRTEAKQDARLTESCRQEALTAEGARP